MLHFEPFPELIQTFEARGKDPQSANAKRAHSLLNPIAVEQADPLELRHPVDSAKDFLSVDEEFFGVMLPGAILLSNNAKEQMIVVLKGCRHGGRPEPVDAPSNLVATGRYVLEKRNFDALRRIIPGMGNELQLTHAIELLVQEDETVHVVVHEDTRHDLSNLGGYIPANMDFGLRSEAYCRALYVRLKKAIADYEVEKGK